MRVDIDWLVDRYGLFEQRVRTWMERWCRPYCSACPHVCCRAHFCIETRQSAFLASVAGRFSPRSDFSHLRGWIGQGGCTLVAGRPPVCYEFVCRPIIDDVAGDFLRHHALLVATMVMTHVGKRVIGGRHLVEATQTKDLNRIKAEPFLARLDAAEAAFDLATDLLEGRPLHENNDLLIRIVPPPRKNKKT